MAGPEPGAAAGGRAEDSFRDRWRYCLRLLRLLWRLSPRAMIANAGVTLAMGLAPLLSLAAIQRLVDAAVRVTEGRERVAVALAWAGALVVASSLQGTSWILGGQVRDRVQERLKALIQAQVIEKAHALPLAAFEQTEVYDQLQRIERGLENRLFSTMAFLFRIGNNLITLAAIALYVGAAHRALPVLLTVGTALFVLLRIRILREKYILHRKQTEPQRRLHYLAVLMTGRDAAAEVRLFGLGGHLLRSWERLHADLRDERLAMARRDSRYEGASSTGQTLTFGLGLTMVVYLVARGALSVGQAAAFFAAVQQFQFLVYALFWDTALVDNDLRYIRDFFLYLDLPEEKEGGARLPAGPLRGGIVLENVRFAYPGSDRFVLDGIDLHLRPGERVALVGENGAGKTTLAKLLLGLYRPTEGRIRVDGIELAGMDPADWRRRTAAVFQDFQQYHLTLRENIAFGNLARAEDGAGIERAAQLSGADTVAAALERGYDTQLGKAFDEGVELSLGQWQKIAVARAYLRPGADVLVLDEPTAALDAKAEVEIYRQFRDVSQGKTVLLISHRLGSARLADRIIVLDGGRIAEEGSHGDLVRRGGIYARMLGTQAQWYA